MVDKTVIGIAILVTCVFAEKLVLNFNCAFHILVSIEGTGTVIDLKGMMNSTQIVYASQAIQTHERSYYANIRFDMRDDTNQRFMVTNQTGTCFEGYVPVEGGIITEFDYDGQPVSDDCPETNSVKYCDSNSGSCISAENCMKYCNNNGNCVTVDSDLRLVKSNEGSRVMLYTWLSDVPSLNMFDLTACNGTVFPASEVCSHLSSDEP